MDISPTEQIQLTTEQKLALRTKRNISVMANAGSGKTFVLVERYRKILEGQAKTEPGIKMDTSSILAITFTKKAAAEMKKKVVNAFDDQLAKLQANDNASQEDLERIKRIREGLTYANISTIHSFCSSLLRQFPIEAGVPVNFSELSEAEKLKLIDSSIDTTMEVMLDSNDSTEKERIEFLLRKFTRNELKDLVTTIIYKIELFDEIDQFFANTDNEIIELIIKNFIQTEYGIDRELINEIKEIVNIVSADDFLNPKKLKSTTARNFLDQLNAYAEKIEDFQFDKNNFKTLEEFLNNFKEISKTIYTQANKVNKNFSNIVNNQNDLKHLENKKELLQLVDDILKLLDTFDHLQDYLEVSRALWEFTKEVREMNDEAKLYNNGLDFDDLQLKTQKLLKNENVVQKIRNQIRYIMIDEFQDTNELQYDIIKALVPEIKQKEINKDDVNLFIVGDPKQSIYGFRNADVRVFYEAVNDIYEFNKICNPADKTDKQLAQNAEREFDDKELLGINKLTSTFRLRPAIAVFVNIICGRIMDINAKSDGQNKYEVEYTPLVCSKDTEKIKLNEKPTTDYQLTETDTKQKIQSNIPFIQNDENSGKVVFLLSSNSAQSDDADYLDMNSEDKEEKLIADFIKDTVNRSDKKYQYKDIAILSRTKSRFTKLSRVLLSENIPFVIHGGNAFYKTEEINDFISFFKFLYNPNDDLALLAILRSPFFNVNDTTLLLIDKDSAGNTMWQKLEQYVREKQDTKMEYIHELLNEFLQQAPSMSISQVILTIIEKTGWMGLVEILPDKQQKIANIDKFIEIARNYEDIGFRNIYDFVEELTFIIERDLLESEAAILTDENAVNIMSVHAAKGLQFPVVIIYNVNKKTGGTQKFSVSGEFGPGFPLKINDDNVFEKKVDSIIKMLNDKIREQKEEAEEKRILYVAMTRAEDILALSVHSKYSQKNLKSRDPFVEYAIAVKTSRNKSIRKTGQSDKKTQNKSEDEISYFAPNGQMKLILEGMGLEVNRESMSKIYDENFELLYAGELGIRKKINGKYKILDCQMFLNIEKKYYPYTPAIQDSTETKKKIQPQILTDNIESDIALELYSPSKFSTFDYNRDGFFDRYILGLHEELTDHKIMLDISLEETPGNVFGSAIHYALQMMPQWLNDDFSVNDDKLHQLIEDALRNEVYLNIQEAKQLIFDQCVNISKTSFIRERYTNIKKSKAEYYLTIPIDKNIVRGYIDLLYETSDGKFEIWDWKSNLLTSLENSEKIISNYEFQMRIYSYFISRLYPEQDKYIARLLFTRLAGENAETEQWIHTFDWTKKEIDRTPELINEKIKLIREKTQFWIG